MDAKLKADCLVAIGNARREVLKARTAFGDGADISEAGTAAILALAEAVETLTTVLVHVTDSIGPSKHSEAVAAAIADRAVERSGEELKKIAREADARD